MAGLSDLSLKLNYWFVAHRQKFRRWWFVLLLAVDFLLVVYVAIALTLYLGGASSAREVIAQTPRTVLSGTYQQTHQPADLTLSAPDVLARGDGRSDIAVRVQNTNTTWAAVVTYAFMYQDETIASGDSYIAPGAISYILGLNASLPETASDDAVTLSVTATDWIYTPAHPTAVEPSFLVGTTSISGTNQNGQAATVVKATITNTAVVGYREVPINIILTVGDQIIGVNQFIVRTWDSLGARDINVQWRRTFASSPQVNVLPVVNPFDQGNVIR